MGDRRYTQEELDYLNDGIKKMPLAELVDSFNEKFGRNKSQTTIQSTMNNYGFRRGKKRIQLPGQRFKGYTEEQIEFVRRAYLEDGLSGPEVAKAFNRKFDDNRSDHAISGMIQRRGFRRSRKLERVLNIGDETLCRSTGYITVKTEGPAHNMKTKRNYRYKHLVVWEAYNGPVPDGHVVRFLDGNKQNCSIENLGLFSRSESVYMNLLDYNEVVAEARETVILLAKLKARTMELSRSISE